MSVLAVVLTLASLRIAYRIHMSAHTQAGAEAPATHTNGEPS